MRPGDLVWCICSERLYYDDEHEWRPSGLVKRGEMMTVIELCRTEVGHALVLHPSHGLGRIYKQSLRVVDETG